MKCTMIALAIPLLSHCMGLKGEKHTYLDNARGIDVAGAMVDIDFRPEGTRPGAFMLSAMVIGGGMATFDGPFRWRIEALGEDGVHQSLVVHRIRTRTSKTKRDEWFPAAELGTITAFKKLGGKAGKTRARYTVPGLLEVMPETDGKLDVWVDLSIRRVDGSKRQLVHFVLDPALKSQNEMIFMPVEVARSIGKDLDEMDDSMWD